MGSTVPNSLRRRVTEVEGWLDFGCPHRALRKLAPLLENPGARSVGLALKARALVTLRRHQEALQTLEALEGIGGDLDWIDLTAAWCNKRLERLQPAIEHMERLLSRNHRSAIGHFNLGCYLALAGECERALDEVSIACGIDDTFRHLLEDESDLDSVRDHPRFRDLMPP